MQRFLAILAVALGPVLTTAPDAAAATTTMTWTESAGQTTRTWVVKKFDDGTMTVNTPAVGEPGDEGYVPPALVAFGGDADAAVWFNGKWTNDMTGDEVEEMKEAIRLTALFKAGMVVSSSVTGEAALAAGVAQQVDNDMDQAGLTPPDLPIWVDDFHRPHFPGGETPSLEPVNGAFADFVPSHRLIFEEGGFRIEEIGASGGGAGSGKEDMLLEQHILKDSHGTVVGSAYAARLAAEEEWAREEFIRLFVGKNVPYWISALSAGRVIVQADPYAGYGDRLGAVSLRGYERGDDIHEDDVIEAIRKAVARAKNKDLRDEEADNSELIEQLVADVKARAERLIESNRRGFGTGPGGIRPLE